MLTVPEAAEIFGTGRSATYEAAQRGQLGPVLRVGRKMFIPTASLRRVLGLDVDAGDAA